MGKTAYTEQFFDQIREGSRRSARAMVPMVMELINPKTVVDVGCGDGAWLSVFHEQGVSDTVGLDGDYVNRRRLQIPEDQFKATDLTSPFVFPRIFDLAVSLEVAEHLPPKSAEGFVDSLVRLAPVVLFSAAIPFQGGNEHLNEQWPEYWAGLFRRHDYWPIDCVRGKVWSNNNVEWWYAQNCLVFASASSLKRNGALQAAFEATNIRQLNLVHPRLYVTQGECGVRRASNNLARSLKNAARFRLRRAFGNKRVLQGQ